MNNDVFEGYVGTYLNNATFSNDAMLLVVLSLLSVFALIFRLNTPLFSKMLSNISVGEKRQSIFESTANDSLLFNAFMMFQALLLLSIFIFSIAVKYEYFIKPDITKTFFVIACLFAVCFLFCVLKRAIYDVFGSIFAEKSSYKMALTSYQALFCTWGMFLYIPVLWILLVGKYLLVAYMVFAISYLAFRAILVCGFFNIFFNKNTGLLFLSLYLCGQELIPLVFLYEGLIYMYNIIETNNIWQ